MDEQQLAAATKTAAAALAAGGVAAGAAGTTFSCAYAGGARVVVRNSLQPVTAFAGDLLLSRLSGEIVRALLTQRRDE